MEDEGYWHLIGKRSYLLLLPYTLCYSCLSYERMIFANCKVVNFLVYETGVDGYYGREHAGFISYHLKTNFQSTCHQPDLHYSPPRKRGGVGGGG